MYAVKALSVLVALLFGGTGAIKIFGLPVSLRIRDRLGVPATLWRAIGLLEWVGAAGLLVGLWVPMVGVAAAVGLSALMLGAVASRLRVHDSAATIAVDLGVLTLVGLDLVLLAVAAG